MGWERKKAYLIVSADVHGRCADDELPSRVHHNVQIFRGQNIPRLEYQFLLHMDYLQESQGEGGGHKYVYWVESGEKPG